MIPKCKSEALIEEERQYDGKKKKNKNQTMVYKALTGN
jgi:hypothetical protein